MASPKQKGAAQKVDRNTAAGYHSVSDTIKIYTDWANHYLEKSRNKRVITDLQADICDGVLLADVIEAVTSQKVQDITTKPRNSTQMVENINACLTFLAQLGVNVEGLNAKDIKDGSLKAILGLFFSLSRFKQQQKSQQAALQSNLNQNSPSSTATTSPAGSSRGLASHPNNANSEMLSRLPSPFKGNTKCPTVSHPGTKDTTTSSTSSNTSSSNLNRPRSAQATHNSADRGRSQTAQNNNLTTSGRGRGIAKGGSNLSAKPNLARDSNSRSTSPSSASSIPTPGGRGIGISRSQPPSEKPASRLVSSTSTSSCGSTASSSSKASNRNLSSVPTKSGAVQPKDSMLDKFKLFKSKEQSDKSGKGASKSASSKSGSSSKGDEGRSSSAPAGRGDPRSAVGPGARLAESAEVGASGRSSSPKLMKAFSKKSLGKSSSKRDDSMSSSTHKDDPGGKQRSIPQVASVSSSRTSLASTASTAGTNPRRSASNARLDKVDSGKPSSQSSKASKIVPPTSKNLAASKARNSTSSSNLSLASDRSGIPAPGSSSIPKPGSRSSKAPKEDSRGKYSKDKSHYGSLPAKSATSPTGGTGSMQKVSNNRSSTASNTSTGSAEHGPGESNTSRSGQKSSKMSSSNMIQSGSSSERSSSASAERERADKKLQMSRLDRMYANMVQKDGVTLQPPQTHQQKQMTSSQGSSSSGHDQRSKEASLNRAEQRVKVKPKKVDSDTQTNVSAIHNSHTSGSQSGSRTHERRLQGKQNKDHNNTVNSADSANVSSGGDSTNSTSNSNNSVSSNDSVIYRPSSCDELESGMESDTNYKPTDHISNLRKNGANAQRDQSPGKQQGSRKMETTFDSEVRTETRDVGHNSSKETTFTDENEVDLDIKPMQPIQRSTPYSYLRGLANAPLPRPSFHIPTLSNQNQNLANSAASRLGVSRPLIDPQQVYPKSMKRTVSNCLSVSDADYGSDAESSIDVSGYMSDGDILRSNHNDDVNSGYMSEGGASLYARRMQQRFREGMQAVKECMQKSSGLVDDDSFDDSSSISSGEISDTIAEISTDENLTGSSLSASSDHANNPYGSLKRQTANYPSSPGNYTNNPNFGKPSVLLGPKGASSPYNGRVETDSPWLRKYQISGGEEQHDISDTRSDGSLERNRWGKDRSELKGIISPYRTIDIPAAGILAGRRSSHGTVLDGRERKTGIAVEDPHLRNIPENGGGEQPARSQMPSKQKRDSETNTDLSALMMRKVQQPRPGVPPGVHTGFALRRPLSGASTGSAGSGSNKSNSPRGSMGGKDAVDAKTGQRPGLPTRVGVQKTSSGSQTGNYKDHNTDMGPESYSASTLERKKRGLMSPKSASAASSPQHPVPPGSEEYKSSTLGRKRPDSNLRERLFGSRGSLNGKSPNQNEAQNMVNSTIISNPHATYSKQNGSRSGSFSRGSGSDTSPGSPYVNVNINNYLTGEYLTSRSVGGLSNPTSPSHWLKSTPGGSGTLSNGMRSGLSETESMESISSTASSIHAQIQQARASGLASRNILQHEHDKMACIVRSDSLKSTQSEKIYASPADLERSGSFSQLPGGVGEPSSPTPSQSSQSSSRFPYGLTALSPNSGGLKQGNVPYTGIYPLSKIGSKDDDLHGSSLSLVSTTSSVYSSAEEKQSSEIRKLRRELDAAQEKVMTLTTQLSTNAHVVAAFEQSLSNMTNRLQQLTTTAEQKMRYQWDTGVNDSELNELRATIEALKQQSGIQFSPDSMFSPGSMRRQSSNASTLSRDGREREPSTPGDQPRMSRHMSSDSMSSINSLSSACSATSQQSSATDTDSKKGKNKDKGKGKNWLRSSFSKAFSRKKNKHGSISDVEPDTASCRSDNSVPNSPLLQGPHPLGQPPSLKGSHSSHALCDGAGEKAVVDLQQQLHEKDMKLTDIRLEALSSAHQLEQLRETMNRMKNEMASLKADNQRLQRMVVKVPPGIEGPPHSPSTTSLDKRLSLGDPSNLDLLLNETADREGRRITISVNLGSTFEILKSAESKVMSEILVGAIAVSGKTRWEMLDSIVRRVFKEYVLRIDPVTNLGLNAEGVYCYHIGEITRMKDSSLPELLPCGYLVGDHTNILVSVKGTLQNSVDALAFETLIPKSIVQRYVSLLLEHRRIILCGPSGTGKTYLGQKLAEFLVLRSGKEVKPGSIATFNVDHKSSKELRQYLANIADQCESTLAGELPSVIILDNLHHVGSLGEVFNGFLSVKYQKCPYIIGTMNQATCSTTNLQLHHNFRWVLCANHMEPVKGFLGRYLRRKLVEAEVSTGMRNNDLNKIVDWMPKVWQHLNKFLETHSSSDVTIGPRLFLSCPMDMAGSQVWFTDLWNYSIVPYLLEAVREGLQLYGRRAPWEDPADWVIESYPWPHPGDQECSLLRLRPEDVGYDTQGPSSGNAKSAQGAQQSDAEGDPLLNMLMRLQEAASYSSPQSNDSDSTSLDSHSSGVQEFQANSGGSGSGSSSVESTL